MDKKQELIDLTKDLIKFKSTKDNSEEIRKCIDYVKEYFSDSVFIVKEFEKNNKLSLIISFEDKKEFDLLLNGHIDVVEANGGQYNPKLEGNKLFGRGSIDMKGGVASMMSLMKELSKKKVKPNVALMIVSDEEIGGFDGTEYLINKLNYSAKFAIAAEPTYTDSIDKLNIVVAEKGTLWLKIKTKGKASHGSRPWLGENAIEKLMEKYLEIKKLFPVSTADDFWKTTINLGKISGGDSPNRVPDNAELIIDVRHTEDELIPEILGRIKKVKDIEIEILDEGSMLFNKEDDYYINKLLSSVKAVTKKDVKLIMECGSSDLRFTSEKGIASVIFGPYGENYHGDGEFVYVSSLELFYNALSHFITETF